MIQYVVCTREEPLYQRQTVD